MEYGTNTFIAFMFGAAFASVGWFIAGKVKDWF